MTAPDVPLDPVRASLDRGLHALAALGGDLVGHANRIGEILWSPPRIVIVGRLKAGKSTLVNALIGAPVAETAALEATNIVAVYQNGAPSRAEVVRLDGSRHPVNMVRGQPADLNTPLTEIAFIHRHLPSNSLADLTLVDTPGLATLTSDNEAATRRVLIDGFEQTRTASVDADAAVFLFDSSPRADEVAFLKQLGFTPLNTLGVLSRADGFGEGALGRRDPIEHATEHAQKLAATLADTVMTVVPMSGLMAETSHTGVVTESDARALAELAHLSPFDLLDAMEADSSPHLPSPVRDRLVDMVGEYGMINGRSVAAQGGAALNEWLAAASGVRPVRAILHNTLKEFAAHHRAQRIVRELDNLAYSHPARDHIRGIVHQLRTDPAMQPVVLFEALKGMLDSDPHSPVAGELRRLLEGNTWAERLGLPKEAPPEQVRSEAAAKLNWAHGKSLSTMTAAEDNALVLLIHTYTGMTQ